MRQIQKGRQDFSDIDNLDRATESFMKMQRKALAGYRPARQRYFRTVDLHKITRFAAVFAVLAVIIGTVVFAGIRFGKQNPGMIQPEPEPAPQITETSGQTQTEPDTTAAPPETDVTQSAAPIDTPATTASTTRSTTTSQITSADTESASRTSSSEASTSAASSATTQTTSRSTSTSSSTSTARQTTSSSSRQAATNAIAATSSTTRTTTTTTRTTTSRTTTSRTTTSRTTTTVTTTTTTAAKAIISITSASLNADDLKAYNGHAMQTVYVKVKNTGNAKLTGSSKIAVTCAGAGTIYHAGCQSGNVESGIVSSDETVYLKYNGSLEPGATDTIVLTIITEDPVWKCTY